MTVAPPLCTPLLFCNVLCLHFNKTHEVLIEELMPHPPATQKIHLARTRVRPRIRQPILKATQTKIPMLFQTKKVNGNKKGLSGLVWLSVVLRFSAGYLVFIYLYRS